MSERIGAGDTNGGNTIAVRISLRGQTEVQALPHLSLIKPMIHWEGCHE